MGNALAAVATVAILGLVVWFAATGRARRLDDRIYESRAGWLMPGGIFYKLGQRDTGSRERWWPYLFGLIDGWMYNAGRVRRRARGEQPPADR